MDTLELLIHGIIAAEANGKRVQAMKNNEAVVELQYMLCQYSHIRRRETEWEAVNMAIDALKAEAQRQKNKPLTLEELRGMRGEPVYVVKGKCQWWDIVDFIAGGWLYLRIANKTDLAIDGYSNGWLAYRRKPEVQMGKCENCKKYED